MLRFDSSGFTLQHFFPGCTVRDLSSQWHPSCCPVSSRTRLRTTLPRLCCALFRISVGLLQCGFPDACWCLREISVALGSPPTRASCPFILSCCSFGEMALCATVSPLFGEEGSASQSESFESFRLGSAMTDPFAPTQGVPKSRIGGSGSATLDFAYLLAWLDFFSGCVPFFFTLQVLATLALCKLLLLQAPFRRFPAARCLGLLTAPVPVRILVPVGVASPVFVRWAWRTERRMSGQRSALPTSSVPTRLFLRFCIACFGFSHLPHLVWGMPTLPDGRKVVDYATAYAFWPAAPPEIAPYSHDPLVQLAEVPERLRLANNEVPGFSFVSAPLPGARPTSAVGRPVLGVTIHAPYYIPTFFGLKVPEAATLDDVMRAIRVIGKLPGKDLDVLLPVFNQRSFCALSFIAFPSIIHQVQPSLRAVILDLTRVGGHYYAVVVPACLSLEAFFELIGRHIWRDTDEVDLWIDAADVPATHGDLAFASGSVFTVLLKGLPPDRVCTALDVLAPGTDWGPFEQSPSPRQSVGEAIVDRNRSFHLPYSLLTPLSMTQTAHKALKLMPYERSLHTDIHLYLDVSGNHCHTVYTGPAQSCPWLLDLRPLGFSTRVLFRDFEPTIHDVKEALPCTLPDSIALSIQCLTPHEKRSIYLPVVLVTAVLASSPDNALSGPSGHEGSEPHTGCSAHGPVLQLDSGYVESKNPSEATSSLQAAVSQVAGTPHVALLPEPFHRIGDYPPDSPLHAHVDDEDEEEEEEEEADRTLLVTVLLFAQEHTQETVRMRLHIPCTVEDVTRQLLDECDEHRYALFPHHTPADPQPSQWWLAFIAQPAWAGDEPTVLLNLSTIDGRCFVASAPNPFSRAQIFRLAQLPNDGTYEVFPFWRFTPMQEEETEAVIPCGTVTIRRSGGRHVVQGHGIDTMLLGGTMWLEEPDLPSAPVSNRCLLVQGHGHDVLQPSSGAAAPTAAEVSIACGVAGSPVHIVEATQQVPDATHRGFACSRIFGVAFPTLADVENERVDLCVTFIDCRPLLQGWIVEVSSDGRLLHSDLTEWLETFAPVGWQVQITGAPIEQGYLETVNGGILVAEYVPETSSEGDPDDHSSERPASSDAGTDSSDSSSDSGSDPPGDMPYPQPPSAILPRSSPDRHRSRSPTRNRHGLACLRSSLLARHRTHADRLRFRFGTLDVFFGFAECALCTALFLTTRRFSRASLSLSCLLWMLLFLPQAAASPLFDTAIVCRCLAAAHGSVLLEFIWRLSCAVAAKLLSEPQARDTAGLYTLAGLRLVARRIGQPWRYLAGPSALHLDDDSDSGTEDTNTTDQIRWTHFMVLAVGFAPELITIALRFPAPVEETLQQVTGSRAPGRFRAFPRLVAASPQPISGLGVLVALPSWSFDTLSPKVMVCVDTTAIDGRIFAAIAPVYLMCQQLQLIADLPPNLCVSVFVGLAVEPTPGTEWCQLSHGDTSFYPEEQARPPPLSLSHLLLRAAGWRHTLDLPCTRSSHAFCLVCVDGNILHLANLRRPTAYRDHIAAAIGARVERLYLFPAAPRVSDAVIDGVKCRTVLAVCEFDRPPPPLTFGVILDLRVLLLGWSLLTVVSGHIYCREVLARIQEDVPIGWQASIQGIPATAERYPAVPGQVFVLELFLTAAVGAARRTRSPEAQATYALSPPAAVAFDSPASFAHGDSAPAASHNSGPPDPDAGVVDDPLADNDSVGPSHPLCHMHFLVLAPEYCAEYITVEVPVPITTGDVLAVVDQARDASHRILFPVLLPVPLQPAWLRACLLAAPAWPTDMVQVLVACFVPPVRLFTTMTLPVLIVPDILRLAGVEDASNAFVYVAASEHPSPDDVPVRVATGELLTIVPAGAPRIPPLQLERMLDTTDGWHATLPEPAPPASLWLVTDQQPIRFVEPPPPRPPVRLCVSVLLRIPDGSLTFMPARPAIQDHAHAGIESSQVYVAALRRSVHDIPYILDLRPVLLGLTWAYAPHGRIDISELGARHCQRCPHGFFVRILGGSGPSELANHFRWVQAGQVITVLFQRRRVASIAPPSSSTPSDNNAQHQAGFSDDDGSDGSFSTSGPSHTTASAYRQDAGTGSTRGHRDATTRCGLHLGLHHGKAGIAAACPFRYTCMRAALFLSFFVQGATVQVFAIADDTMPIDVAANEAGFMWNAVSNDPARPPGPQQDTPVACFALDADPHPVPPRFGSSNHITGCPVSAPDRAGRAQHRRLPTPCRAGMPYVLGPTSDDDIADLDQCLVLGFTLLENSIRRPDSEAFMLAATLLDTLQEFQTLGVRARTACRLSLDTLVPPTAFQADAIALANTIPTPVSAADYWSGAVSDWLDTDLTHLCADSTIPSGWRDVFAGLPTYTSITASDTVKGVVIYTDGSADARHTGDIAPAAWSFAVWFQTCSQLLFAGCSAHSTVPLRTPFSLGETDETPFTAELLALAWSLVWALEFGASFGVPIEFRYDCTSAGGCAFASMRAPACRSSDGHWTVPGFTGFLRQALELRVPVFHRHVAGHNGDTGNELCDKLAKFARKRPEDFFDRCLPLWPHEWWRSSLAQWGWLAGFSGPELPRLSALEAEAHRMRNTPFIPCPPDLGVTPIQRAATTLLLQFTALSYNVLTMYDPNVPKGKQQRTGDIGLMIAGKREVLKRQLLDRQVWLAGFQETRLHTSATLSDGNFIMLNVAANSAGQYGCALWINKQYVYAVAGDTKYRITADQVTITSYSERHLQAFLETPCLRLLVLVAHGPRARKSQDPDVQSFWQARTRDILQRPQGADFLLLADANAHVGSIETDSIGQVGAESENWEGECFHSFLCDCAGFLPSTSDVHEGQPWTWSAPGDDPVKHRLDYIALPQTWRPFINQSRVWSDFEALQARQDHLPVLACISFSKAAPAYHADKFARRACRPQVAPSLEARTAFCYHLANHSAPTWSVDVDVHYKDCVQGLRDAAEELCEPGAPCPRQPYLQADSLALVQRRRMLRHWLHAVEAEDVRRRLMIFFAAWIHFASGSVFSDAARTRAEEWLRNMDYCIATIVELIRESSTAIRAAVRRDRNAYLESLVKEVTQHDMRHPKQLYAAVRRAFPAARSSRRSAFQPLPAVLMADGSMAQTQAARASRWIEFFGEQEAGKKVDAREYQLAFSEPDIPIRTPEQPFSVASLPALQELEQQLLRAKYGKACGPDGLTAEVFRLSVPHVSKRLFPICLKASLGLREPSEWRGGSLHCLAKRASAALECAGYRSILMASTAGKAHHRILRDKLMPHFQSARSPLQFGQVPGVSVEGVAHIVRTYQCVMQHRRRVCAVTFYDVKAAFYQVLRQALIPGEAGPTDTKLLGLLHGLGVPDYALSELLNHLHTIAALPSACDDEHLTAQVADLFRGSWFRLDGASDLVLTRRGTRPGDPLADLLFGFLFSAYLRSVDHALAIEDLETFVPQPQESTAPFPVPPLQSLGCMAWADDFAHLQSSADCATLCDRVVRATSLLVTHATAHGMVLTFAKDKSAVLLCHACDRSPNGLLVHDQQEDLGLQVFDSVAQAWHFLPVVDSYRHLGTIAVANAKPGPEISFRTAKAQATLKPLRRKLFSNPAIALPVRRNLLRALVVSKFVFSSCAIILQAGVHRRQWCRSYVMLWRALCRWFQVEQAPHSYQVLHTAAATSPLLSLAQARASYLSRVFRHGPPALLHLLLVHWLEAPSQSWIGQFSVDVQTVTNLVAAPELSAGRKGPVEVVLEGLYAEPAWWLGKIRKAVQLFSADIQAWMHTRAKCQARPSSLPPPSANEERLPFVCEQCSARFRLRKHLAAHAAKAHGVTSPTRHFAFVPYCLACHKWYHTLSRVQYHLKRSHACLRRVAQVIAPMTIAEVRECEADEVRRHKLIKQGTWGAYRAAPPPLQAFFPRLPTASEAVSSPDDEDALLSDLIVRYRPSAQTLTWVRSWIDGASTEGPRADVMDFWTLRPTSAHSV